MISCGVSKRRATLALRIWQRGYREMVRVLQLAYLYVFAIPFLLLKGAVSFPLSANRGYGSFLLVSDTTAVKIRVSRQSTIEREFTNYLALTQRLPEIATVLPHFMYTRSPFIAYLQSDRLFPVEAADALLLAVEVRRRLDSFACTRSRLALEQCPKIISGLQYIETLFDSGIVAKLRTSSLDYLDKGRYEVGLAHGDFHSRNILLDRDGNSRLIDLDCIRFEGIKDFDALYFALELEWSASGILWVETLGSCLKTQGRTIAKSLNAFGVTWSDGLGFTFFLDRIGQDLDNFGPCYTTEQLMSVIEALPAPTS